MIDANEPEGGDYVRYLDRLVNASHQASQQQVRQAQTGRNDSRPSEPPQQALRMPRVPAHKLPDTATGTAKASPDIGWGQSKDTAWGASTVSGAPAPLGQAQAREAAVAALQQTLEARRARLRAALPGAAAGLAHALRRIATVASFAGIVMIAAFFVDEPPFFASPFAGILLLAAGGFLRRIAGRIE